MIYDGLRGPVDYIGGNRNEGPPCLKSRAAVNYSIFSLIHSALLLDEEGLESLCI